MELQRLTVPGETWEAGSPPATSVGLKGGDATVTLHVSAGDTRRIIRALEQTSLSLCGSPSGSRLASSYMRLAGTIRQQASD